MRSEEEIKRKIKILWDEMEIWSKSLESNRIRIEHLKWVLNEK